MWDLNSRQKLVEFAEKHNIPMPVTKEKPYSSDENLLHISFEGGILEDPWNEPDEAMFKLTVSPEKAPERPTYLEMEFKNGNPVALDGRQDGAAGSFPAAQQAWWSKMGSGVWIWWKTALSA